MSRDERRALQDAQRQRKALAQLSSDACELVLVRHGETDWNVELRIQGQLKPGPSLNAQGRRQAAQLAEALAGEALDAIYSSDLARAEETAAAIAAGRTIQVVGEAGLRERHMGALQGASMREAAERAPDAFAHDPGARVPGGGESTRDLTDRAVGAVEAIAARHPGQRVLLVLHGGVLHALYHHLLGHPFAGRVVNCSVHTIRVEGRRWALVAWNDTLHLADVGYLGMGQEPGGGAACGGAREGDAMGDRI